MARNKGGSSLSKVTYSFSKDGCEYGGLYEARIDAIMCGFGVHEIESIFIAKNGPNGVYDVVEVFRADYEMV